MIKSIFKRSGLFFGGSIISKIFTTSVYILLSRYLNPAEYGQGTLGVTVVLLGSVFGDYGLTQWYQKHDNEELAFSAFIKLRLILATFVSILAIVTTLLLKWFTIPQALLIGIIIIMHSLLSIATAYLIRNNQVLKPSFQQVVQAIPILILIFIKKHQITVFDSFLGYAIGDIIALYIMFPFSKLKYLKSLSIPLLSVLRSSSKYALLNYTSVAYARADSILIRGLSGEAALGFYGLAYRYLEYFALFPSSLVQTLFPVLAQKHKEGRKYIWKLMGIMSALGVIFSILLFSISHWIITTVHGVMYMPSIAVMQVLSLTLFLFFINAPLATFVQSSNIVKKFLPFGVSNTALNIVLNIILVPKFGIVAAAWVMTATEFTGLIINLYFVNKIYRLK